MAKAVGVPWQHTLKYGARPPSVLRERFLSGLGWRGWGIRQSLDAARLEEGMMLTPDEQLALDILDALDLRAGPSMHPVLNEVGRDERWRLEQTSRMADALVSWLERWMDNPQQEDLRLEAASLWQSVTALHDHLVAARGQLRLRVEEMDEATEGVWLALSVARGRQAKSPGHGSGQRGSRLTSR
jgi:hypothetical protein